MQGWNVGKKSDEKTKIQKILEKFLKSLNKS
jgi:hypothetical protein